MALQVHDRMTEQIYVEPLNSFVSPVTPSPVFTVPVLKQGRHALEEINEELGLAFDEQACHISDCSSSIAVAAAHTVHCLLPCTPVHGNQPSTLTLQSDRPLLLQDLVYYTRMFQEEMKRDPTNVELFDMAQSNSEHRHVTNACELTSLMECPVLHSMQSSPPLESCFASWRRSNMSFSHTKTGRQYPPAQSST